MAFITLYITHPNPETAKKIVHHLLEQKLISCANTFPIQSAYWWEGKITESEEVVTLLKTTEENWKKVESEILKIHPYDIPCIIKMKAEANLSYENWIARSVMD